MKTGLPVKRGFILNASLFSNWEVISKEINAAIVEFYTTGPRNNLGDLLMMDESDEDLVSTACVVTSVPCCA